MRCQLLLIASLLVNSDLGLATEMKFSKDAGHLSSLKIDGKEFLVGGGAYIIGSKSGFDDPTTNYHSGGSDSGQLINDLGEFGPSFKLKFTKETDNSILVEASVGPMPFKFDQLSFPIDLSKQEIASFAADSKSYYDQCAAKTVKQSGANYSAIQACHPTVAGQVGVAIVSTSADWGEAVGPSGKVRVEIIESTGYSSLRFYNHPYTNNIEVSFGSVKKTKTVSLKARIVVTGATGASKQWKYEGETDFLHQIGFKEGDGWAVNVASKPKHYAFFGPYVTGLPAGKKTARFRLLLDNVVADNASIVTLDVYDAAANKVLASKKIQRKQFNKAWTYQDFNLDFTNTGSAKLEFRGYYHGSSYVRLDRVVVE